MPFQIVIKVTKDKKKVNKEALANQIANVIESFTGKRTIVNVKEFSGAPSRR